MFFVDCSGVFESGRHPKGILDHIGSILVEYQPEWSHMDLIRTKFHDFVKNLAFSNLHGRLLLLVMQARQDKTGPSQTKQASQPSQSAVFGLYTTNIQSLYSTYTGLRMPDFGQNHEIWSESGPYGSVCADTHPFRIPYGLG